MNLICAMSRPPVLMLLCLLAGCKTHLDPVSYSPDYAAITRADGRVELVPQACVQPAAQDEIGVGEDFQPLLPPGCASNLILLQMVEQRVDVMHGRDTGPVMAAPVGAPRRFTSTAMTAKSCVGVRQSNRPVLTRRRPDDLS